MKVIILPSAEIDLAESITYLDQYAGGKTVRKFRANFTDSISLLADNPRAGRRLFLKDKTLNLRHWLIKGFSNWRIIYRVTDTSVEIFRVIHGSRDLESLFSRENNP